MTSSERRGLILLLITISLLVGYRILADRVFTEQPNTADNLPAAEAAAESTTATDVAAGKISDRRASASNGIGSPLQKNDTIDPLSSRDTIQPQLRLKGENHLSNKVKSDDAARNSSSGSSGRKPKKPRKSSKEYPKRNPLDEPIL